MPARLEDPEATGPKVNAVGELKDQAGKVVATLLVLQLPTPPEAVERGERVCEAFRMGGLQAVLALGGAEYLEPHSAGWGYKGVAVFVKGVRRDTTCTCFLTPRNRPDMTLVERGLTVSPSYTVSVLFPFQLPKEAVVVAVFGLSHESGPMIPVPTTRLAELVIPEQEDRPMLPPLRASVVSYPHQEGALRTLIHVNRVDANSIWRLDFGIEGVRIGQSESQSLQDVYEKRPDGSTMLLTVAMMSNPPQKDAPISLKIRGIDPWVSTEPEKGP